VSRTRNKCEVNGLNGVSHSLCKWWGYRSGRLMSLSVSAHSCIKYKKKKKEVKRGVKKRN